MPNEPPKPDDVEDVTMAISQTPSNSRRANARPSYPSFASQTPDSWYYEIYTKDPKTGQGGWDISVGFVTKATTREDAINQLETHYGDLFDVVIQLYVGSVEPLVCSDGRGGRLQPKKSKTTSILAYDHPQKVDDVTMSSLPDFLTRSDVVHKFKVGARVSIIGPNPDEYMNKYATSWSLGMNDLIESTDVVAVQTVRRLVRNTMAGQIDTFQPYYVLKGPLNYEFHEDWLKSDIVEDVTMAAEIMSTPLKFALGDAVIMPVVHPGEHGWVEAMSLIIGKPGTISKNGYGIEWLTRYGDDGLPAKDGQPWYFVKFAKDAWGQPSVWWELNEDWLKPFTEDVTMQTSGPKFEPGTKVIMPDEHSSCDGWSSSDVHNVGRVGKIAGPATQRADSFWTGFLWWYPVRFGNEVTALREGWLQPVTEDVTMQSDAVAMSVQPKRLFGIGDHVYIKLALDNVGLWPQSLQRYNGYEGIIKETKFEGNAFATNGGTWWYKIEFEERFLPNSTWNASAPNWWAEDYLFRKIGPTHDITMSSLPPRYVYVYEYSFQEEGVTYKNGLVAVYDKPIERIATADIENAFKLAGNSITGRYPDTKYYTLSYDRPVDHSEENEELHIIANDINHYIDFIKDPALLENLRDAIETNTVKDYVFDNYDKIKEELPELFIEPESLRFKPRPDVTASKFILIEINKFHAGDTVEVTNNSRIVTGVITQCKYGLLYSDAWLISGTDNPFTSTFSAEEGEVIDCPHRKADVTMHSEDFALDTFALDIDNNIVHIGNYVEVVNDEGMDAKRGDRIKVTSIKNPSGTSDANHGHINTWIADRFRLVYQEDVTMSASKTVMQALKEAGVPLDFHGSDLYALKNEASAEIVQRYVPRTRAKTFISNIDGKEWYDIPFGNDDFWTEKGMGPEAYIQDVTMSAGFSIGDRVVMPEHHNDNDAWMVLTEESMDDVVGLVGIIVPWLTDEPYSEPTAWYLVDYGFTKWELRSNWLTHAPEQDITMQSTSALNMPEKSVYKLYLSDEDGRQEYGRLVILCGDMMTVDDDTLRKHLIKNESEAVTIDTEGEEELGYNINVSIAIEESEVIQGIFDNWTGDDTPKPPLAEQLGWEDESAAYEKGGDDGLLKAIKANIEFYKDKYLDDFYDDYTIEIIRTRDDDDKFRAITGTNPPITINMCKPENDITMAASVTNDYNLYLLVDTDIDMSDGRIQVINGDLKDVGEDKLIATLKLENIYKIKWHSRDNVEFTGESENDINDAINDMIENEAGETFPSVDAIKRDIDKYRGGFPKYFYRPYIALLQPLQPLGNITVKPNLMHTFNLTHTEDVTMASLDLTSATVADGRVVHVGDMVECIDDKDQDLPFGLRVKIGEKMRVNYMSQEGDVVYINSFYAYRFKKVAKSDDVTMSTSDTWNLPPRVCKCGGKYVRVSSKGMACEECGSIQVFTRDDDVAFDTDGHLIYPDDIVELINLSGLSNLERLNWKRGERFMVRGTGRPDNYSPRGYVRIKGVPPTIVGNTELPASRFRIHQVKHDVTMSAPSDDSRYYLYHRTLYSSNLPSILKRGLHAIEPGRNPNKTWNKAMKRAEGLLGEHGHGKSVFFYNDRSSMLGHGQPYVIVDARIIEAPAKWAVQEPWDEMVTIIKDKADGTPLTGLAARYIETLEPFPTGIECVLGMPEPDPARQIFVCDDIPPEAIVGYADTKGAVTYRAPASRPSQKHSAGILAYRRGPKSIEVLLVHPGGPHNANRDDGVWSIPKGEYNPGTEDPFATAFREFHEETGTDIAGLPAKDINTVTQASGKVVHAWTVEADLPTKSMSSNTFEMEHPRGSGTMQEFPEVDRWQYFTLEEAEKKLIPAQVAFLRRI